MAFLMSIAEQFSQPSGLWEWLILKVFGFIGDYGWRILLFTVLLKLVLFPLDLFQRIKMRKNQKITERMKPQLEKLQQQYAGDKQTLAQKQMELNKKEGFSYFSSCIPAIVTMVIFFYLFAGLNNISQYMNLKQYAELYDVYTVTETAYRSEGGQSLAEVLTEKPQEPAEDASQEEKDAYQAAYAAWSNKYDAMQKEATAQSQAAVKEHYESKGKESFLWVKNIWSPDVPWTKPILSEEAFKRNIGNYSNAAKALKKMKAVDRVTTAEYEAMLSRYTTVTGALYSAGDNRVNGWLILPILSMGLSFLSQFITSRLQKKSGQIDASGGMAGSMKVMMIAMPLMMGFFALQYTTAFSIYIVINSGMSVLINVFTTLAMDGKDKKNKQRKITGIQKYGRPDPKDL